MARASADRPGNEEERAQALQRLGSVLERRADDEHEVLAVALDGDREDPRALVEPRIDGSSTEDRSVASRGEVLAIE